MFITHAQFSNIVPIASEALPRITENTATLLSEAQRQDDDRDPFTDLDDDEEELETNELLVEDL